ncbi:hypothetical protein BDP81DRAFT_427428 [Colletotrichum phormii]|uniref:Transmembrane protein n=1 Tax=Colletotrichum phormii TaxID=359342 RepID=A0AAI9ZT88_9PEZI|nr:uncharacterized protein BDP81DRAFT_427428 [Colletotrichum phormii]KAK1637410.1 hypothetical protein BDP81DRAFT_427428 [Colletotrichum phormii]
METDYLVKGCYCERMMEENVPDPDVTGWGIISSFCFSIIMNMIAIIVAYATKALPENRYNPIDDIIHSRGSSSPDREQRIKAFESFMLSLSDQQLVTGMALMLATILIFAGVNDLDETFSVYSFQIATRLGYFSCITHLCSLTVLWDYFDKHKRLRLFRTILMVAFLAMMIGCMTISDSVTFRFNRHVSVKCARKHFKLIDRERPNYVFFSDEIIIIFNLSVLTYILISGYVQRLLQLYCPSARYENDFWQRRSIQAFFGPESAAKFRILASAENKRLADVRSSFLWEIVWLLFYFTFGTANLLEFFNDANLKLGAIKPNFGQLVPLFLLALPLITALEAYSTATAYNGVPPQDLEDAISLHTLETNASDRRDLLPTSHASGSQPLGQAPGNQSPSEVPTVPPMEEPDQLPQASETSASLLLLLLVPYAAGLMLWALIFADVIPHSFFLSIAAWVVAFLIEVASFRSWFTIVLTSICEVVREWYLAMSRIFDCCSKHSGHG